MPRGGHNKLSTSTKRLKGTLERSREPQRLAAPAEVGPPPSTLTAHQRASWRELAPQVARVFSASDRAAFTLLVKLYTAVEHPEEEVPAYVYAGLVGRVTALLEQFGCTPKSRRQVDRTEEPTPDDPLDEFAAEATH